MVKISDKGKNHPFFR